MSATREKRLTQMANIVFGEERGPKWLATPLPVFGGETPTGHAAKGKEQARDVTDTLKRIHHGMY